MIDAILDRLAGAQDSGERRACMQLIAYGLPAAVITLVLACFGDEFARVSALAGAFIAWWIVGGREVYPFARIADRSAAISSDVAQRERLSQRLEANKGSLKTTALIWLALLLLVAGASMFFLSPGIMFFGRVGLIDEVTRASAVFVLLLAPFGKDVGYSAAPLFAKTLAVSDHIIIISISLFLSITGSCCLYWLSIYLKAAKEKP